MPTLPFSTTITKKPTAVLSKPWYEHPVQLRCLCGVAMYPRHDHNTEVFVSRFECGDDRCGKFIVFVHDFAIDYSGKDGKIAATDIPTGR